MGFWNKITEQAATATATAATATTPKEESIWVVLIILCILGFVWLHVIWLFLVLNECWNGGMESLKQYWAVVGMVSLDNKGGLFLQNLTRQGEINAFVRGFADFKRACNVVSETYMLKFLGTFIPTKIVIASTEPKVFILQKKPNNLEEDFRKVLKEIKNNKEL